MCVHYNIIYSTKYSYIYSGPLEFNPLSGQKCSLYQQPFLASRPEPKLRLNPTQQYF